VRQLGNELRRVVAMADPDTTISAAMLSPEIRRVRVATSTPAEPRVSIQLTDTLASALSAVERQMIASALKRHSGQLDGAARALGISRKGLYLKRQRLGL
jgi:hydrogenase-4 transcriptional activator